MGFDSQRWSRRGGVAVVAVALLVVGRGLFAGPRPSTGRAAAPVVDEAVRPAPQTGVVRAASAEPEPPPPAAESPLPGSLRGSEEDGALRLDERGDLVVDPALLAFFDYYLAASGEESDAAIKARIAARIHARLSGEPELRAIDLLDRYFAFRGASRGLRLSGASNVEDVEARLEVIRKLRREHFANADADRLFGDQERTAALTIAAQRVAGDATLTAAEQQRKLAEIEEQLPEAERAARAASSRPMLERAEEDAMRAAGASAAEIQRHRVAALGEAAAQRLGVLDEARAAWGRRLEAFRAARGLIERSTRDPAAKQAAIAALLASSFTPEERLRVQALDALAAAGAP
jgi:lipase chaperone LimK